MGAQQPQTVYDALQLRAPHLRLLTEFEHATEQDLDARMTGSIADRAIASTRLKQAKIELDRFLETPLSEMSKWL